MDTTNKPKTIATINVNLPAPHVPTQEWTRASVEEHLNCTLCGTEIVFAHKTDFIELIVIEDAHCPGCRARRRETVHSLQ